MNKFGLACLFASAAVASPTFAATFSWNQGSSGDNWSQAIATTSANTIQWSGTSTSYGDDLTGPFAHSHSQDVTWTMYAVMDDGSQQTIFSQLLNPSEGGPEEQSLVDLGVLSFAGGNVTAIGLGCVGCSNQTFHQFDGASFTLGTSAVPEPASWALMVGGFGLIGAAARRQRKTAVSFN